MKANDYLQLPLDEKRALVAALLEKKRAHANGHVAPAPETPRFPAESSAAHKNGASTGCDWLQLLAKNWENCSSGIALSQGSQDKAFAEVLREAKAVANYLNSFALPAGSGVRVVDLPASELFSVCWGILGAGLALARTQQEGVILTSSILRGIFARPAPEHETGAAVESAAAIHSFEPSLGTLSHRALLEMFELLDGEISCAPSDAIWVPQQTWSDSELLLLLWFMSRGGKLLFALEPRPNSRRSVAALDFSLLFFSNEECEQGKYDLVTEAARFGDAHDFKAIWVPERHFHSFGGIYPNPAVLCAALATITKKIRLRAGSVVLPLQDPIRVAEAWSMVDNLSGGRVDISFASGWNPNDFVLSPDTYANHKQVLASRMEEVRKLWRGERKALRNGKGETVEIGIYPKPVQPELSVWLTAAGNPNTFQEAGRAGCNVLTMLFSTTLDELAKKILIYRQARAEAGHPPDDGIVTLMLHTFVHPEPAYAQEKIRDPFQKYIRSSLDVQRHGYDGKLSPDELEKMAAFAFERYSRTGALFGAAESCLELLRHAEEIGVNEIACQLDFGIDTPSILEGLVHLEKLQELYRKQSPRTAKPSLNLAERARWISKNGITHWLAPASAANRLDHDSFPEVKRVCSDSLLVREQPARQLAMQQIPPVPRAAKNQGTAIAIIGMAGRFPGARTLEQFWNNIILGKECISDLSRLRAAWRGTPKPLCLAGALDDIESFDADFFEIAAAEAACLDPHQRLFLETAWSALEEAGYHPGAFDKIPVGLFVGMYSPDFNHLISNQRPSLNSQSLLGRLNVMVPNRVSHLLNLRGPSEIVDTACSSSLVAVHRAIRAIETGECDMAIAGGISLLLSPVSSQWLGQVELLSPDGRCRPFDATANGLVRGEGVGAVLLKPLAAALADGDHIHGVIRGSGANHNGATSNHPTTPSSQAQTDLLVQVYRNGNIDPQTINYLEAHGGASALGDFVEVTAFKRAFETLLAERAVKPEKPWCGIGALKSSIGSLDAAAGIASLIKVVLALEHRQIPPTVHFETAHPDLGLDGSPFFVTNRAADWPSIAGAPRRAGVHAYGLGGVNAHVVVEEFAAVAATKSDESLPELILLSARDAERLAEAGRRLLAHLQKPNLVLSDIAFTLQTGRKPLPSRTAIQATSVSELASLLEDFIEGRSNERIWRGQANPPSSNSAIEELVASRNLAELARLWVSGVDIPWQKLPRARQPKRIPLPSYPFAPIQFPLPAPRLNGQAALHPLLDRVLPEFNGVRIEKKIFGTEPIVADHRVRGEMIFPAAGYLEMARAGGDLVRRGIVERLENVSFVAPLRVPEDCDRELFLCLQEETSRLEFRIESEEAGGTRLHCSGAIRFAEPDAARTAQRLDLAKVQKRCSEKIEGAALYEKFARAGVDYGRWFRGLEQVHFSKTEAIGVLRPISSRADRDTDWGLSPSQLDSLFQLSFVLVGNSAGKLFLPFSLDELIFAGGTSTASYAYLECLETRPEIDAALFAGALLDETGRVIVRIHNLWLKAAPERSGNPVGVSTGADHGLDVSLFPRPNSFHEPDLLALSPRDVRCGKERAGEEKGEGVRATPFTEIILRQVESGVLSVDEAEALLTGKRASACADRADAPLVSAQPAAAIARFASELAVHGWKGQLGLRFESESLAWTVTPGSPALTEPGLNGHVESIIAIALGDFEALTSGTLDPTLAFLRGKIQWEKGDSLALRQAVGAAWFRIFNQENLEPRFAQHLLQGVYETGEVKSEGGLVRKIFPWAIPANVGSLLYRLIAENKLESTLEIGMAYGLSTVFICQALADAGKGRHTAIDPCQALEFQSIGLHQVQRAGLDRFLEFMGEPDFVALPKLLEAGRRFELVFIDGLHLFDYTLLDFFYADRLLAENGWLIFDDAQAPGVAKAAAYVRENRAYEPVSLGVERIAAFRKASADSRSLDDPNAHREF